MFTPLNFNIKDDFPFLCLGQKPKCRPTLLQYTVHLCTLGTTVITTEAKDTNSKGLGLLFETGEIIVSKNSEHVRFGLFITANYSKEELNAELTTAVKEVRKIKEIPGIKSDPKKTTKIVQVLLQIDRMVNVIRKTLSELLPYSDPTQCRDSKSVGK